MGKSINFALAMGGNIGDSAALFRDAAEKLERGGCTNLAMSGIYRYPAVDCIPGTPDFFNAALTGEWNGTALELLRLCQEIEVAAGRPVSHSSRESRTLDLDLILFGDEVWNTPELTLPHPRAQKRRFVLEPLAGLIPDVRFPDSGRKIAECLAFLLRED